MHNVIILIHLMIVLALVGLVLLAFGWKLRAAAQDGVDVRLLVPGSSNLFAVASMSRAGYRALLEGGVRVFEYQPTKLHTKLYVVDRATWIGSANFDMRSLFVNLELMLRIEDRAFADHVRGYIDGEIAQSVEITRENYRSATGLVQRAKQFVAYLLMGIFFAAPHLSLGGKPVFLMDLPRRQFTLMGYTFLPTDTLLFMFVLGSGVIGIFLLTALFGRGWCGWGCPQTVYLEFVYRPLERLFLGQAYGRKGAPVAAWRRWSPS